jgi:hypothetical protein
LSSYVAAVEINSSLESRRLMRPVCIALATTSNVRPEQFDPD